MCIRDSPKEWIRQEQIQYTADYIQKTFVDKGMCADWSIHDKGDAIYRIESGKELWYHRLGCCNW